MRNRLDLGSMSAHSITGSKQTALVFTPPLTERGAVDIGKVNVMLIGLIVVILCGLLLKEEGNSGFSNQVMQLQTQVVSEVAREEIPAPAAQENATVEPTPAQSTPVKPAQKLISKKPKKIKEEQQMVELEPAVSPVVETHTSAPLPVVEPVAQKEPQKKMLVFNLWSVSELRLRRAYTTFMNDSSISAHALEARKKDYLNFVNQRTKKCGELDNKFAGNINTVEKLTFSKGDMDILECHTAENNAELDTLNTAYGAH